MIGPISDLLDAGRIETGTLSVAPEPAEVAGLVDPGAEYVPDRTPTGRAAYAERTWLSEAPNGWIKHVLGFRRFSLRGLANARGEWDLVCLALNVNAFMS